MKKKRIYLISQTESELTQRGKRHPDLAKLLSQKGYDVTYISSNFYHADKLFFSEKKLKEAQALIPYKLLLIKTLAYKSNFSVRRVLSNLIFAYKVYRKLKKTSINDSIIIVPSRPIEILYYLSKIKRKKANNFEVIVDIRDVWPDAFKINNRFVSKGFNFYCNLFLKRSIPNFDKFLHVSPSFLKWLHRYHPNAKSEFIPLGYNKERFNCGIKPSRLVNEPIKIVYIGLLQYQIDIMPYIKAINEDQRFELYLYGDDGKGQRYKTVKSYVETNNISNVFFKGRLEQNQVCEYLKQCDIGIIPMITSSLPNKVFDYLGSELPILSLGENDCSGFVKDNQIGWSSSFDVENIKMINDIIYRDFEKDYQVKKKKVASIKENYSREVLFKKIIKVIEN
jgi:hypothetical protein